MKGPIRDRWIRFQTRTSVIGPWGPTQAFKKVFQCDGWLEFITKSGYSVRIAPGHWRLAK